MAYSLFRARLKPGFLCNPVTEGLWFTELREEGFPYMHIPVFSMDRMALFFANEQIKRYFCLRLGTVKENSPGYHQLIGEVLGYPPAATKFFARSMTDQHLKELQAFYSYAGMTFVGSIDDQHKIAFWCWEKIPINPTDLKIQYQNETLWLSPPKRVILEITRGGNNYVQVSEGSSGKNVSKNV